MTHNRHRSLRLISAWDESDELLADVKAAALVAPKTDWYPTGPTHGKLLVLDEVLNGYRLFDYDLDDFDDPTFSIAGQTYTELPYEPAVHLPAGPIHFDIDPEDIPTDPNDPRYLDEEVATKRQADKEQELRTLAKRDDATRLEDVLALQRGGRLKIRRLPQCEDPELGDTEAEWRASLTS